MKKFLLLSILFLSVPAFSMDSGQGVSQSDGSGQKKQVQSQGWFSSINSSIASTEKWIGFPRFSLRIAPIVAGYLYVAPDPITSRLPGFIGAKTLASLPIVSWSALWLKRVYELHGIEKNLKSLYFAQWRATERDSIYQRNSDSFGALVTKYWPSARYIRNEFNDVHRALQFDARKIFPDKFGVRVFKKATLILKIREEKALLERTLDQLATLTLFPEQLIRYLTKPQKDGGQGWVLSEISDLDTSHQKVLKFAGIPENFFQSLTIEELNAIRKKIPAPESGLIEMCHIPSWQPWRWVIAPCSEHATKLYWEALKYYIRISALYKIVVDFDWDLKVHDKAVTLIGEAVSLIGQVQGLFGVGFDIVKNNEQIYKLGLIRAKLETAGTKLSNSDLSGKVQSAYDQCLTIGTLIRDSKSAENSKRMLAEIHRNLNEVLRDIKD